MRSPASSASRVSSPKTVYSGWIPRASFCGSCSVLMRISASTLRPRFCRSLQPSDELLHGIGLHVAVEQRFLGFLRELVLVVERVVAAQDDFTRRRDGRLVLVVHLILDA